jgi:hypothetical protein
MAIGLGTNRRRAGMRMALICTLVLGGCATPIKSREHAYSYLGRIVEATDETVTEQYSRPSSNPLRTAFGAVGALVYESTKKGDDNVIVNKSSTYREYKVALEQGEHIMVRSHVQDIGLGDCVRVWIIGPGVSPAYWYAPDASQIEAADGCRAMGGAK